MLPFSVSLLTGRSIYEQVTYAVTRAVVSGQLRPGDAFPSVRSLSQELKINPNTSHKIVAALIADGLLVVRPGIGTVIAELPPSVQAPPSRLDERVERLVIESKRAGLTLPEVVAAVRRHWERLVQPRPSARKEAR